MWEGFFYYQDLFLNIEFGAINNDKIDVIDDNDDIVEDDRVDVDVDVVELNRAAERSDELELSDTIKMNKSTLEPWAKHFQLREGKNQIKFSSAEDKPQILNEKLILRGLDIEESLQHRQGFE